MAMFLSRYLVEASTKDGYVIIFSTFNGAAMAVKKTFMETIRRDGSSALTALPTQEARFITDRFMTTDTLLEKQELNLRLNAMKQDKSLFSLTVALTMDCTLRCVYCYQQGVRTSTHLSGALVPVLIDLTQNRIEEGARKVRLHLYGGEPLLVPDLGLALLTGMASLCKECGTGLDASMTTNGVYLTREIAKRFADAGLRIVQISIDGPRDIHNIRRMPVTGHGTYDVIMKNIQNVQDILRVVIRVNVDKQNVDFIPAFMDDLVSMGLSKQVRLNLELVSPIWDSVPHCEQYTYKDPEEMVDMLWLWEEQEKRHIPTFGVMPIEGACENLSANSITVDPHGRVFMCPGFLGMDGFVVGSVSRGYLADRFDAFISVEPWRDCLDCSYCPVCRGGCRMCAYVTTRDYGHPYCKKHFFDKAYPVFLRAKYGSSLQDSLSHEVIS